MSEMNIKMITQPDYSSLSTTISVPFPGPDRIIMAGDIHSAQDSYIAKRDRADAQDKASYDKARAVCKWAESCGATLKAQRVQNGQLHLSFGFPSLEQLKEFEENAIVNVEGATMVPETVERAPMTPENNEQNNEKQNGMKINLVTRPDYDNLTAIVSIPSIEPDCIIMVHNVHSAEDSYIAKRDRANNVYEKITYDRARAVCKWAESCGASLKAQRVQDRQLYFSFGFSSPEQLKEFEENATVNISGATMTADNIEQVSRRGR